MNNDKESASCRTQITEKIYCDGGGLPPIGGRVIFNPDVLDFGLRERLGFPFLPDPNFGLSVGLSPPDGGRVKPSLPDPDGFAGAGAAGAGGAGGSSGTAGATSGMGGAGGSSATGSGAGSSGAGGGRSDKGGVSKTGSAGAGSGMSGSGGGTKSESVGGGGGSRGVGFVRMAVVVFGLYVGKSCCGCCNLVVSASFSISTL